MSDDHHTAREQGARLDGFAAELTGAAYPLVLQRGLQGSWLRVELALWRAMARAVEKWGPPPSAPSAELDAWREGLVVDLTASALSIAMQNGIEAPLLEVERGLSRAFRLVIGGRGYSG
jgi:hypothetical protein